MSKLEGRRISNKVTRPKLEKNKNRIDKVNMVKPVNKKKKK